MSQNDKLESAIPTIVTAAAGPDLEPLPAGYQAASDAVIKAFESLETDPAIANSLDTAAQQVFAAAGGFPSNASFRDVLVEQNLVQAASLLQRAFATRTAWLAERDRIIGLLRDTYETARAIITHESETSSGYYDLDLADFTQQAAAEDAMEQAIDDYNAELYKAREAGEPAFTHDAQQSFIDENFANMVQRNPSVQRKIFLDEKTTYENLNCSAPRLWDTRFGLRGWAQSGLMIHSLELGRRPLSERAV